MSDFVDKIIPEPSKNTLIAAMQLENKDFIEFFCNVALSRGKEVIETQEQNPEWTKNNIMVRQLIQEAGLEKIVGEKANIEDIKKVVATFILIGATLDSTALFMDDALEESSFSDILD